MLSVPDLVPLVAVTVGVAPLMLAVCVQVAAAVFL